MIPNVLSSTCDFLSLSLMLSFKNKMSVCDGTKLGCRNLLMLLMKLQCQYLPLMRTIQALEHW